MSYSLCALPSSGRPFPEHIKAHIPQRSALGLAVGRLRDHETEEVSEKAKALVARWVAAAPAKKRQESPSKSTQISQKGA